MLPFLLKPYLRKMIWGGSALAQFKNLPAAPDSIGESWEVSAMPGCESVVDSGEMKGMTLADVCRLHGAELLGVGHNDPTQFPLLIKFIDANADLSVQVHPGDELAMRRHGCHGKNEMWYIIDTRPGARLCAGLTESLTPDAFFERVAGGTLADTLRWYPTAPGDVFFLPAGSVHAIGAGNLLLEVQQPSDITYRIYDYDRRDEQGNKRQLHLDQARDAIDYTAGRNHRVAPRGETLLDERHFTVRRLEIDGIRHLDASRMTALLCVDGQTTVTLEDNSQLGLGQGHTLLVPSGQHVAVNGRGTVICVTP